MEELCVSWKRQLLGVGDGGLWTLSLLEMPWFNQELIQRNPVACIMQEVRLQGHNHLFQHNNPWICKSYHLLRFISSKCLCLLVAVAFFGITYTAVRVTALIHLPKYFIFIFHKKIRKRVIDEEKKTYFRYHSKRNFNFLLSHWIYFLGYMMLFLKYFYWG